MVSQNVKTIVSEKIKQDILKAWKEGHGGSADQVHIMQGEDGLVLMIPKALYQAEIDLHSKAVGGGKVLNQYLRTLLQTVASEFIPLVEEITKKKVDDVVPLIDLRAGWALAFFRF